LALALGSVSAPDSASAEAASGFFRYGAVTLEVAHAYLFRVDTGLGEESMIFLTPTPIDAAFAAAAFDVESAVDEQIGQLGGGYIRICFDADGFECGLYFSNEDPPESFNSSGSGEFVLETNLPDHVKGSFVLAEPEEFFDQTFQFELHFDAARTPGPEAEQLAEGGGAPGAAYLDYLQAIAAADFPKLREILGPEGSWQFPEEDLPACKENLKWMRDGTPVTATIWKGEQRQHDAILFVDGVDRDEIRRRGRVLMILDGEIWRYEAHDLESVEE
jgi:hypothetical protein